MRILILFLSFLFINTSQAQVEVDHHKVLTGTASFYHKKFEGRKTATGAVFQHQLFSGACNKLPLNTYVRVTNLKNEKQVIVLINDRMAAHNKRLIDLTFTAAQKLGFIAQGLIKVKVEVLSKEVGKQLIIKQTLSKKTKSHKD